MESDYWNISRMNGSPLGCYDNGYMDTIMWTLPHEKVDDVAQYFNTLENIHLTWMEYISNFFFTHVHLFMKITLLVYWNSNV
jgi:hypothetical protein